MIIADGLKLTFRKYNKQNLHLDVKIYNLIIISVGSRIHKILCIFLNMFYLF